MTAALYILAAVGATVLAGTAAVVGFLLVSVHLDQRAAAKRHAEADQPATIPLSIREIDDFAKWEREVSL